MKKLAVGLLACCAALFGADSVPSTAVIVSTDTVVKTVSREPRMVVLMFSPSDGTLTADVSYETVTRVDGNVVASIPFKTVSLTWQQVTNLVPALSLSLEQFKSAAKASMTNTP